jgi:hypothetical protein
MHCVGKGKSRYYLGNGNWVYTAEECARGLLERDFPEIVDGTLRGAVFAPDFVVPKHPEVVDYPVGPQKGGAGGNLKGEETERLVLDKLKDRFQEDVVVRGYFTVLVKQRV